jgi:hypothetical protein
MYRRLIIAILTLLCLSQNGWGWGFAHKVVARIAEKHLTPKAAQAMERYFDSSIVDYSLWLDKHRNDPEIAALNINHMGMCNEDFSCDAVIKESGNLEPSLVACYERLKSYKELPDSVVHLELKILIHLVGDMHCPSHFYAYDMPKWTKSTKYRSKYGWFKLTYNGKEMTYHSLWDYSLNHAHPEFGQEVELFVEDLDKNVSRKCARQMVKGSVYDWAKERNIRCKPIYDWAKPGDVLDDSFFKEHGALADEMVLKAGYRLAHLLNQLFD